MLCEKCKKNNATFFFEENINGKKRSFSLCQSCAEELQGSGEIPEDSNFFDSFGFSSSLSSLHDNLFAGLFSPAIGYSQLSPKKTCSSCGSTLADLQKLGKVGCGECYKTFSEELDGTIRSIHGNAKHIGRAPAKSKAKHAKENELKTLKKELKNAIANEEFEQAAILRDKIKSLEGKE